MDRVIPIYMYYPKTVFAQGRGGGWWYNNKRYNHKGSRYLILTCNSILHSINSESNRNKQRKYFLRRPEMKIKFKSSLSKVYSSIAYISINYQGHHRPLTHFQHTFIDKGRINKNYESNPKRISKSHTNN